MALMFGVGSDVRPAPQVELSEPLHEFEGLLGRLLLQSLLLPGEGEALSLLLALRGGELVLLVELEPVVVEEDEGLGVELVEHVQRRVCFLRGRGSFIVIVKM